MATKWEFGFQGEEVFKAWLKRNGYYIVPASLIDNGGAPMLEGHLRKFVLPDVLAARNGISLWVDVKTKERATYNGRRQRLETGCELRHFNDYLAVQKATGITGALAFVHTSDRLICLAKLDDLTWDCAEWHGPFQKGHAFQEPMVFFNVERFERYSIEDNQLLGALQDMASPPQTVQPWEPGRTTITKKSGLIQKILWEAF